MWPESAAELIASYTASNTREFSSFSYMAGKDFLHGDICSGHQSQVSQFVYWKRIFKLHDLFDVRELKFISDLGRWYLEKHHEQRQMQQQSLIQVPVPVSGQHQMSQQVPLSISDPPVKREEDRD
jgi:hypothetical protein